MKYICELCGWVYSEEETGAAYYHMAKVVGPRARVKALFPNGVEARFELDGDRGPGLGCIVVGEKGKLEINAVPGLVRICQRHFYLALPISGLIEDDLSFVGIHELIFKMNLT